MLNTCVRFICKARVLENTCLTCVKHIFNISIFNMLDKTHVFHVNDTCALFVC